MWVLCVMFCGFGALLSLCVGSAASLFWMCVGVRDNVVVGYIGDGVN